MKKIFKISLAVVVMFTTLNVHAVDSNLLVNFKKEEGKKVSFTLNEINKVKLSIYDSNDVLLFNENVLESNKLSRTYDLMAFPEGEYYMIAESDLKISKYKLEVKGSVAKLYPEAISEVFKPIFQYNPTIGQVYINLNNTIKMPVSVKIYDGDSDLIYSKTKSIKELSSKSFNMKDLKGNDCTFVVSYNGKTFEKTISF